MGWETGRNRSGFGGRGDGGVKNPNKDVGPHSRATLSGSRATPSDTERHRAASAGGRAGPAGNAPRGRPPGPWPRVTRGRQGGRGKALQMVKPVGTLQPQASGLDSHAGIRGQKDNKSYFSCKRSWTSGKIRAPLYDMPNC